MKATEILNKKLSINSTWYGYASHEIVDFEIAENGRIIINYDDHFNGEDIVVKAYGYEVDTITRYSLILK